MNLHLKIAGLLLTMILFASCQSDKNQQAGSSSGTVPESPVSIPAFNRDSALAYVVRQVEFGPRNPGSPGHAACKDWIVSKLRQFGADVEEQDFTADLYTGLSYTATNIIGRINPGQARRIVLAAHWDTRYIAERDTDTGRRQEPIAGADDGASGVAVLLEIARTIQANPVNLGIDLVFFDAEDQGDNNGASETWCLGAQHWARNLGTQNRAQYGILLDMVGARGATFPREGFSVNYANAVVEKVWSLAQSMGYGHYFVNERIGSLIDDHLFVNQIAGIPMIDIIHHTGQSFGRHWHTHDDDINIIDRNTLRAVGQVVTALLYKESVGAI
jgi:glutaminyl-peptide cyclotransferase